MAGQSFAASKLCAWAVNIVIFNKIFKKVQPLVEEKDRASAEVEEKQKELAIVKEKVRILNEKVTALKKNLEEAETIK
jgi:dynein heavy chain